MTSASALPEQRCTPGSTLGGHRTSVAVSGAATPAAGCAPAPSHTPAADRFGHPAAEPDFGPNVRVFGPGTPAAQIQAALDAAAAGQGPTEFDTGRCAFLFEPGTYAVDVPLGRYTSVAGLGLSPDDVTVTGTVRAEGRDRPGGGDGAPTRCWRSAENLAVAPPGGVNRWAVSQAAPLRRVHVRGQLSLVPREGGSAGGGFIADCVVDGRVADAPRQQRLVRDSSVAGWSGAAGNQVFAGVEGSPAQPLPGPPYTTVPTSPLSREKPYLYLDGGGRYRVFLPGLRHDGAGAAWTDRPTPGSSVPLEQFFVARPTDSVRALNKALAQGRHLLLTPGIYPLDDTVRVKWAGTVVLGLGYATLRPRRGTVAMSVADARGVRVAGLLFDAGPAESPALLEVGVRRGARTDPGDPASVQDVFFRVGGAASGRTAAALVVNSDNVLLDHVWAWRADGGTGTGRMVGAAGTGVVVNGDDVLATGLFAEHFQEANVVWNGDRGRTITFPNELPYEPYDLGANDPGGIDPGPYDQAAYDRAGGLGGAARDTGGVPAGLVGHPAS